VEFWLVTNPFRKEYIGAAGAGEGGGSPRERKETVTAKLRKSGALSNYCGEGPDEREERRSLRLCKIQKKRKLLQGIGTTGNVS